MPSATGVTVVKSFTYRDAPGEEWSGTYWLTGSIPTTTTAWESLFAQLIAVEAPCYASTSSVVRCLGYNNSDPHTPAAHIQDFPVGTHQGTLTSAAGRPFAGDQAGMVQVRTDWKNTRGKWVYLRKYMHDGFESGTDRDQVSPETLTAYHGLAGALMNGVGLSGRTWRGPERTYGVLADWTNAWVTTRTLKRRGKRPLVP